LLGVVGSFFDDHRLFAPALSVFLDLDGDPVLLRVLRNSPHRLELADDLVEILTIGWRRQCFRPLLRKSSDEILRRGR
jgi:hypothetical protein